MYKIGGRAHSRGITFISDIARVYASESGSNTVKVFSARSRNIKARMRKMPLLRVFPAFGKAGVIIFAILAALLFIEAFVPEAVLNLEIPDTAFCAVLAALAAFAALAGLLLRGSIKRLLQYHGAEHMALGTYQKGKPLTAENISQADRANPNCGSMFTLIVIIICVPLMFVPYSDYFFPVIFFVAFELTLLARKVKWLRWLLRFGMWGQRRLFTRQPGPAQIETARRGLIALIAVMDRETKATH